MEDGGVCKKKSPNLSEIDGIYKFFACFSDDICGDVQFLSMFWPGLNFVAKLDNIIHVRNNKIKSSYIPFIQNDQEPSQACYTQVKGVYQKDN